MGSNPEDRLSSDVFHLLVLRGSEKSEQEALGQVISAVTGFVLQTGGKMIDVGWGDVEGHPVFQERCAVTSDRIASKLYQQPVNGMRIILLRRQADDLTDRASH